MRHDHPHIDGFERGMCAALSTAEAFALQAARDPGNAWRWRPVERLWLVAAKRLLRAAKIVAMSN